MYDLTEFTELLHHLLELFDRLIPLEQSKLEAVSQNRVSRLEEIIKREQADILSMRGLDQKRVRIQEKLGWKDLTFREILEQLPPDQRPQIQILFDELSSRVRTFQSVTDSSRSIMEVNLHNIEKLIAAQTPGKNQTYTEDGFLEKRRHTLQTDAYRGGITV